MCGRYVMARAVGDLVALAEAEADENLELRQSWNVAPTTDVPIVLERLVDDAMTRRLEVARWGLIPGWAKDASVGVRAFNARSETIIEKPTFRSAIKSKRCAIPVDGYYEWLKPETPKGKKRPFFVHPADDSMIFFAGIYEWWKDKTAEAVEGEEAWVLSCSIMTMASPAVDDPDPVLAELGQLHDRLPVPLGAEALTEWLNPENKDAAAMVDLATSQAFEVASTWNLREVGPAVGNVRNNGPELVEPRQSLFS
ncbi:SOS response-associated peptidase [Neomicrococcus aestuarii]|uniref:Abasic site processing protein n=1 Tax=Neomicrococcus aestuarii TaxID=556325 RepID=A0A1L2ZKY6_9MICC|nr:SOS response-associated peptidase [Neomicrococcus aestuarii]APF40024.1 hypothetical protein BHE16_02195 [Neomicrococcus aestuarii]